MVQQIFIVIETGNKLYKIEINYLNILFYTIHNVISKRENI